MDAVVSHSIFNLNFDASKSGGATALPAPTVVSPLLGWKKLEERREEKKVLYGRRVERFEDSRLVK